jgi:hypothetical protein
MFSLITHNGVTFCQVEIRKAEGQFKLETTEGYQLWKGDIPNFTTMARKIVISGICHKRGPTRKINEA